jgi:hypothetical protein
MSSTTSTTSPDGVDRGYPVETPVGTMYLRHVGWGVLVDNSSNTVPHVPGRPYLTIAGKEFTASVGVYPDGNIERCYVQRRGSYDDAAPSYVAKIRDAAREAALRFIAEHPEHVAAGERYRAEMDVYSAEATMQRLEPEYKQARKTLREARKRLATAENKLAEYEGA